MIELNIFTNSTDDAPSTPILDTLQSWIDTFGNPEAVRVYYDPHPNQQMAIDYLRLLRNKFDNVMITKGLADGYIRSLKDCSGQFIFQLEHDWKFKSNLIKHPLGAIVETMRRDSLYYMRFNRHKTALSKRLLKWQSYVKPKHNETTGVDYCETDNLSNNPHIIDRQYYVKHLAKLIDPTMPGAGLVEESLTKKGYAGNVYGKLGYPPTIIHTDGRKGGKK